jgi:hypothetical protein
MKRPPQIRYRPRLRSNPAIGGFVCSIPQTAMHTLGLRVGDRVWLRVGLAQVTISCHPCGPRPNDGRISVRIRRVRSRRAGR